MAGLITAVVWSHENTELAVVQQPAVHRRHRLTVFVKAADDVPFRRDTDG